MKAERLAKTLQSMTHGKSSSEALSASESFIRFLTERGYAKLLPAVLRSYTNLLARERTSETVVTVAKDRDVSDILAKNGIATTARTRIDETIVGGYTIETDSRLIDASHKSALLKIYQNITR